MKLHHHLVIGVLECLEEIFNTEHYADKVVERAFKAHPKWGVRDRHFVAETIYGIVRWQRLIFALAEEMNLKLEAEGESLWDLFAIYWLKLKGGELPAWEEFDFAQEKFARRLNHLDIASYPRAVRESIPDWIDEIGFKEIDASLGKGTWAAFLKSSNQQAPVILRVNELKTNRNKLMETLTENGISVRPVEPVTAVQLNDRANVFRTQAFKDGWFEVQDRSSQLIAPLLDVKSGERIIDACAGAGGKTLHMAAMMKNKGKIIALDIHAYKLQELKLRGRRAGVDIVESHVIDSTKTIKRLKGTADGMLLDVPCSGLGVLRRNPDSKWKLTPESLARVKATQREILEKYSVMVKPTGRLVYATCSVLPSENQEQIEWFLKHTENGKRWRLEKEIIKIPGRDDGDGFYGALLVPS
jgi:16S rRNA (cytosine967-C5)-methyltransferase